MLAAMNRGFSLAHTFRFIIISRHSFIRLFCNWRKSFQGICLQWFFALIQNCHITKALDVSITDGINCGVSCIFQKVILFFIIQVIIIISKFISFKNIEINLSNFNEILD